MRELRVWYRSRLPARISALEAAETALNRRDPDAVESLRRIAHMLRGSGATCGFPEISESARTLDEASEGDLLGPVKNLLDALRAAADHDMKALLSGPGREIHLAHSGAQAQTILEQQDVSLILLDLILPDTDGRNLLARFRERPDLVLLDVKMPQMDGWTFMKFVRAHRDLAAIPVIFLTGAGSVQDRERGLRLGAEGYLVKPVDADRLLGEVASVLDRRGITTKPAAGSEGAAPAEVRLRMSGRMDQVGLLSIFSILGAGERTGVLEVRRGSDGDRGRVLLRKGRVASARVEGRRPAWGLDAVETLGKWREGAFTFIEEEILIVEDPAASLPRV